MLADRQGTIDYSNIAVGPPKQIDTGQWWFDCRSVKIYIVLSMTLLPIPPSLPSPPRPSFCTVHRYHQQNWFFELQMFENTLMHTQLCPVNYGGTRGPIFIQMMNCCPIIHGDITLDTKSSKMDPISAFQLPYSSSHLWATDYQGRSGY